MSKPMEKAEYNFPQPKEKVSFCNFLYNSKEGTIFGRTGKSWGQLLLFYTIFYIVLAALFAICMQGLFSTLNDQQPKWQLDRSLIGTNPGLGFRPLSEQTERGAVIQYNYRKEKEADYWINNLNEFMHEYNNTEGRNMQHCNFNQTHNKQALCTVNIDDFGACTAQNGYGYKIRQPCVFLKLNKIFGWEPEYYDNPEDLPASMPDSLKEHIKQTPHLERQQIWVSCNGLHPKDKEVMSNITTTFYPRQGFPAYYYPYLNQPGYLSPLVAVRIDNPPLNLLTVECRAWAKNIVYNGSNRDRMGSVIFDLTVE